MIGSKSAELLYRIATKTDSEYRKYGKKFFNYGFTMQKLSEVL